MLKPILYCDIDGVLNIDAKVVSDTVKKIVFRKVPFGTYFSPLPTTLNYNPPVIDMLRELPARLFWLSAWNHYAVKVLEPITLLKSEGVIHYQMNFKDIGKEHGKYLLLKQHQAQKPQPFIWVDNVATKNYDPKDWENFEHPHLVIRPVTRFGLTNDHMAEIQEFTNRFSTS